MNLRKSLMLMWAMVAVAASVTAASAQQADANLQLPFIPFGNVYVESNATDGNAVLVYERALDGRVRFATSIKTGGTGTGIDLGSQGAVALSDDERWLVAVNAGSDDVSLFEVQPRGLRLVDRTNAGAPNRSASPSTDHSSTS
jgi:6-phosphogluconolactonase